MASNQSIALFVANKNFPRMAKKLFVALCVTTTLTIGLIAISLFVSEIKPFQPRSLFFSENIYPAPLWDSICIKK